MFDDDYNDNDEADVLREVDRWLDEMVDIGLDDEEAPEFDSEDVEILLDY